MKSFNSWKIQLLLDGIDVSENLSGTLSVEREENAASIAEFTLVPFAGPISVTQWIGKPVEINYGEDEQSFSLFRGVVDEPVYNPTTKLTQFTCSDQLQEHIEQLDREDIDWGYWSESVFSVDTDNWRYAQDRLSTIPFSLNLDQNNILKLTPWQAKSIPDFAFTDNELVYQSLKVQLANRRQIHNSAQITFQYRYQCFKQREVHFDYQYPLCLCAQLKSGATMPNVEMITKAIEGTGWLLQCAPVFTPQYPGDWYMCEGERLAFVITPELQEYLVRGSQFTLMKRFDQTTTEEYQLNVQAPQSIHQLGTLPYKSQFTLEIPADSDKFKNISQYQLAPEESLIDSAGDYVLVQDNINLFNQAISTVLNLAKTQMLEAHRQNLVSFQVAMQPNIDTQHTVKITSQNVKAMAKVKQIAHQCDFEQGSSLSTITLAVSRTDDLSDVYETALSLDHQIDLGMPPEAPHRVELPTHFGGALNTPVFNTTWDGYSGNTLIEPNAIAYPEQFALSIPEIVEAQTPLNKIFSQEYHVEIPNELLEMSA